MVDDVLICLRFFSRLPVPVTAREIALGVGGLGAAAAMAPLAGLLIGLIPASILGLAIGVGLPPMVAAALAVTSAIIVTGALHEDALADCADGFGGGATRERKLEIMRDSRIGAYGTCAIGLSLILRVGALAALAARDIAIAVAVVLAAAAVSRALCLLPLALLGPARLDGNGAATRPEPIRVAIACGLGLAVCAVPLVAGLEPLRMATASAFAFIGAFGLCELARRQIGGQTGDVAGAVQQAVEIVILIALSG